MTQPAFEDLLAQAQFGEGSAFAELWSRHATMVAAFVRGRGAVDVDEITSDTFLAAFGRLASFSGDESGFRGLLLTIARRRVIDEFRARRKESSTSWSPFEDSRTVRAAEDTVVEQFEHREVLALVQTLTPDQRDVILLRLVAELTIEEVASVMGKRPGSIKSLQHRALETLRRAIDAEQTAARPDTRPTTALKPRRTPQAGGTP